MPMGKSPVAAIMLKLGHGHPDGAPDDGMGGGDDDVAAALHEASMRLINGVHAKDPAAVAEAFEDAFRVLESAPHEEGPGEEGPPPEEGGE